MQRIGLNMYRFFHNPYVQLILKVLTVICLMCLSMHAYADGTDQLSGTDANAWATLNGTGKKFIYFGEIVVAAIAYITTKNPRVLLGVLVICLFLTVALTVAGAPTS